jgi:hypothetical protein
VEGIVAKPLRLAYKAGRVWAKVRHADTVDATVVGFTGTARHPKALAVQLPDGRVALSQRLTTALASVVGPRLLPQVRRTFTEVGDCKTVLLPAGVISSIDVAGQTIHVGRTKDEIKNSPEFDKDKHIGDPGYHEQVGGYYGDHRA